LGGVILRRCGFDRRQAADCRCSRCPRTLETANRAPSLSRTTGYDLAKRGRYPCTVLRLGNAYRVVTSDLLKLIHIDVPERTGIEEEAAATPEAEVGGFSSSCCCCCVRRCARRREGRE
jgi:hypothetical protein